ncbi:MAG: hypothetical protein UT05_C0002G0044 [Parcubacteria group bacterium GW2011_GWF2_38_76]|nr:MAG: hypothetical protein UT05_C0002G0044 [Parcubacteria group bacterium GW2011_GWF2_38_76]HBM45798.1 hypothetical protein [Patescibacteria group bacterium]
MNINSPYITYALIALVAILLILAIRLEIRIRRLLRGNNVKDVEGTIVSALNDIEKLTDSKKEIEKEIQAIKTKIRRNIQTAGTIRFNPFGDAGGNQSFASAFLDDHGDGVVLSSLYARDKVSVFAKPIKKLKSDYELSGEEKEAMRISWENRE